MKAIFSRPSGTGPCSWSASPTSELVGYCQSSLRDAKGSFHKKIPPVFPLGKGGSQKPDKSENNPLCKSVGCTLDRWNTGSRLHNRGGEDPLSIARLLAAEKSTLSFRWRKAPLTGS